MHTPAVVSLFVDYQPCCVITELHIEKEELDEAQGALQQAKTDAAAAKQEPERLGNAQERIRELERDVECLKEQLASARAVSNLLPGTGHGPHRAVQHT